MTCGRIVAEKDWGCEVDAIRGADAGGGADRWI